LKLAKLDMLREILLLHSLETMINSLVG